MDTKNHNTQDVRLSRRRWLKGTLALIAAGLSGSATLQSLAATGSIDAPLTFMSLSQALTAPHILNPAIGQRLYQALTASIPNFATLLAPLSGALASGSLPQAQETLALNILQAWYLGTVNDQVITYEHALMFAASKDVQIIRSYCSEQSGFWARKPGNASS